MHYTSCTRIPRLHPSLGRNPRLHVKATFFSLFYLTNRQKYIVDTSVLRLAIFQRYVYTILNFKALRIDIWALFLWWLVLIQVVYVGLGDWIKKRPRTMARPFGRFAFVLNN